MSDRKIIYVFTCGCHVAHTEVKKYHEMSSATRAKLRKLLPNVKFARHQRYCEVHGHAMAYRTGWCMECGTQIDYDVTGGSVPPRCPECAEKRNKEIRASASKKQREAVKAGRKEKKAMKRSVCKIKRGDYCSKFDECLSAGMITMDQAPCLKCQEFTEVFRGVDPVVIAVDMRQIPADMVAA